LDFFSRKGSGFRPAASRFSFSASTSALVGPKTQSRRRSKVRLTVHKSVRRIGGLRSVTGRVVPADDAMKQIHQRDSAFAFDTDHQQGDGQRQTKEQDQDEMRSQRDVSFK